jgi:acyl-CoA thioester hydrolase, YbgC/YbaW family
MENGTVTYRRKVNYYETDCMGIVHHSNYIRFFEEARLDLMSRCGLSYRNIEEMGIIIPVTFVECEYVKPLRYDDNIRIESCFAKYHGVKLEVSYEIYREGTQELCTRGKTGHCFLDREMKPVRMKREFPELYQKLMILVGKKEL